jgi:hypothetical protein
MIARLAAAVGAGLPMSAGLIGGGDADPTGAELAEGVGVAAGLVSAGVGTAVAGDSEPGTGLTAGPALAPALASGLEPSPELDSAMAGTAITNSVVPT